MFTDVTIEKDTDNKTLILATSEAKEKYSKKISVGYEAIDMSLAEEFLTAAGMEKLSLDEVTARKQAKEAMKLYPPQKLKDRFDCTENLYCREEISDLYSLVYLHFTCSIDAFTAFTCIEDDEFWVAAFPETVHTCAFLCGAELKGNDNTIQQAILIRRRQLVELNILSALVVFLRQRPDNYTIDAPNAAIPKGIMNYFERAGKHIDRTIKDIKKEQSADHFIAHESQRYDFDWLKKKADLKFLNSATITMSNQAVLSTSDLRSVLFQNQ